MELRTMVKNDFRKDSFKMMNNSVFRKTMENVRKRRDIKLVINYKRQSQTTVLHTTKCYLENLLTTEMNKVNWKMKKTAYLSLSILDISKIAIYEY